GLTGASGTFSIRTVTANTFTVAAPGVTGTYTSGGTWTQYTLKNNTSAAMAVLNLTAPVTDVAVTAEFALSAPSGAATGRVARYSGPRDNNSYSADVLRSGNQLTFRIFRNQGTFTQLASNTITTSVSNLTDVTGTLDFEVVGNSLKLFFDDGTGSKLMAFAT